MIRKFGLALAGALLAWNAQASAAVRYSYTEFRFDQPTPQDIYLSFSFVAPTFLATNTEVTPLDCYTIFGTCAPQKFIVDSSVNYGTDIFDLLVIQIDTGNGVTGVFRTYQNGTFNQFGTTELAEGYSILKIEPFITRGGAVPEPSAWALLIAGFGAVGAAMRRGERTGLFSRARQPMRT